jgi:hypothetical protein
MNPMHPLASWAVVLWCVGCAAAPFLLLWLLDRMEHWR